VRVREGEHRRGDKLDEVRKERRGRKRKERGRKLR
jgi:hypothetical protein